MKTRVDLHRASIRHKDGFLEECVIVRVTTLGSPQIYFKEIVFDSNYRTLSRCARFLRKRLKDWLNKDVEVTLPEGETKCSELKYE